MNHPALRYVIVIATAAFLQYTVITQFRIAGVSADLLLVIAIAAGMIGGAERGAIVGFASGLCLDLMVTTPFGLCAISGLVAGVVAGLLEDATVHSAMADDGDRFFGEFRRNSFVCDCRNLAWPSRSALRSRAHDPCDRGDHLGCTGVSRSPGVSMG